MDGHFNVDYEKQVKVLWKIPCFSKYKKIGEQLLSPSFSSSATGFFDKWYIVCWPNGSRAENAGYISLGIFSSIKHYSSYDISILSINSSAQSIRYTKKGEFDGIKLNEIPKAADRNTIINTYKASYLPEDVLTIAFQINVNCNSQIELVKKQECLKFNVADDLERLLEDKEFTDIHILAKSKKIGAHMCILSRIPYFKALFTSRMKEMAENVVIIEDVDEDIVEEIIRFIYTGTSAKLRELSDRLVVAADRFGMEDLKELCEMQLLQNLSSENFCSLFLLADRLALNKLKSACLIFSANNMNEIIKSQEFDEILMPNTELLKILFQEYASIHN